MVRTVSVPATSANLGPGYDSFGVALTLRNEFTAGLCDAWSVTVEGEGAGVLPVNVDNQVVRAMARVFAETGQPDLAARVVCRNAIPVGRGLGSSSAAIVGGLVLADALVSGGLGQERLFELAVELEGHPDNVAAALFGGMTVCWVTSEGPHALRVEPFAGLAAVVSVSDSKFPTLAARAVLPDMVPHADAAFNVSRAALLVTGIAAGDATLLREGLADRIHEQYRAAVVPDLEVVKRALLDAGADGAALSGAGPSIIGLVMAENADEALGRARDIVLRAHALLESVKGRSQVRVLGIDRDGALLL
ncbi:MAG: homoserine kinase [Coriobacteriia bacterium]|nr:homoserine kinase [Coriobacteriia bacterium]